MPDQAVADAPVPSVVALLGDDYPGIRPRFAVAEGDVVQAGQILFHDRARPRIAFAAPISGRVKALSFGARRTLSAAVIEAGDAPPPEPVPPEAPLRDSLLAHGLWPAFRTRPFGRIPDPDATPATIFVDGLARDAWSPDPVVVVADAMDDLARGLQALADLAGGDVHLCTASAAAAKIAVARIRLHHGAGRIGAQIARMRPKGPVWTIDIQDVIAIGRFLATGVFDLSRIVALAGPALTGRRLIRTVPGARLTDLVAGKVATGTTRLISGDVLAGRDAAWLGRYHSTVCAVQAGARRPTFRQPIIPTTALDGILPARIPAVPLMRALSVGDTETARRLGCLHLVEEDIAPLSAMCTSGADYAALLRQALNTLEGAA